MKNLINQITDPAVSGQQKDFRFSVTAGNPQEAEDIFLKAGSRLMDVNGWDKVAGGISAVFRLTDSFGNDFEGPPAEGNYIRIDIPGPGTVAGEGYDWVRIESVLKEESGDEKLWAFKVRPAGNPKKAEKGTAHFLSDQASSTFLVYKKGNEVISEIHGRNEKPNIQTTSVFDKTRNLGVAAGAIAGIANIQWHLLANGLLK